MKQGKVITIEDRIPRLKEERKRKANRRLIFYLSLFFLLILLVVYLQSPLSKVGKVEIQGNFYVSDDAILKAGQINENTSFWNISRKKLANKIKHSDVQIASVTVKKRLPNTLVIEIDEFKRVAYLKKKNSFFPILENGEILDGLDGGEIPVNAPIIINADDRKLKKIASEIKKLPHSIIQRISEITFTSSKMVSYDLVLYMNDGFEVRTSVANFAENMKKYPLIVNHIEPGKTGIIHLNVSSYFEERSTKGETSRNEGEG